MTVPPKDPPAMWFKQVPNNSPDAPGVWSKRLLENHHTVARSYDRPRQEVDAVNYQDLRVAAQAVLDADWDMTDPKKKRLHDVLLRIDNEWRRDK